MGIQGTPAKVGVCFCVGGVDRWIYRFYDLTYNLNGNLNLYRMQSLVFTTRIFTF